MSVTIDLNSWSIDRALYSGDDGSVRNGEVIYLSKNATLTITDTSRLGCGKIEGGNSSNGAGGIHAKKGSRIYMYGGEISYCESNPGWDVGTGGAVYLEGGAEMYMYGGKLSWNYANQGGAVYINRNAHFYMYGGEISYCRGFQHARIGYGSAVYICSGGYGHFCGGTICNNYAVDAYKRLDKTRGDIIYAKGVSIFEGTEIRNNTARSIVKRVPEELDNTQRQGYFRGGSIHDNTGIGVSIVNDDQSQITEEDKLTTYFGGNIQIYNNVMSDGTLCDVRTWGSVDQSYVNKYVTSFKVENFSEGAKIGIYVDDTYLDYVVSMFQVSKIKQICHSSDSGKYAKYFFSDRSDTRIINDENGVLDIKKISEVGADSLITGISSVKSGDTDIAYTADVTKSTRTATIHVPKNTDVTSLAINFSASGTSSVTPTRNVARDYTNPVTYTLLNQDGRTEQNWTVKVVNDMEVTEHNVTVNSGTGSGTYKDGSEVSVAADEVENKRFTSWTAEGVELTEAQAVSPTLTFEMPSNDVTLTANYKDLASVVDIAIDEPQGGKPLPEYANITLNDDTTARMPISWSPNEPTAGFNSTYNAVITFTSEYGFSSNLKVNLNGEQITPKKPDSKTLVVTKAFTTAKAKLLSIPQAELTGVKNGTSLGSIALPSEIEIVTEDKSVSTAAVTWDKSAVTDYDSSDINEQTFFVDGTVTLPDDIDQNGVSLDAQIKVTVSEKTRAAAPTANLVNGSVYDTAQSLVLSADNAEIYYTTDGSEPTTSSTKYEGEITLARDSKADKVYTIKAIAVPNDSELQQSKAVEFKYTVLAPTYEVTIKSDGRTAGLGGGKYHEGDTVTVQTAAMTKGFVFKSWSATGITLTDEQKNSPSFTFTMPNNAVTLTPNFINTVTEIELNIDTPTRGNAFDKSAGYALYNAVSETAVKSGDDAITVSWSTADKTAKTYTEYTATVVLKPNYANELIFDDEVTAKANGAKSTVCVKNDDGSVTVMSTFVTEKATFVEIPELDLVYKPYNALFEDYLPNVVRIVTDDADIDRAYVEWDAESVDNPEFDPDYDADKDSKEVEVTGTVILPENVKDTDEYDIEIDTSVSIYVTVANPAYSPLPRVDLTPGIYTENKTVTLSVDDESTIYYKLNGGEETIYTDPIEITGTSGESVTTKITAYTKNTEGEYMSSVHGDYVYTIELPVEKQTVSVSVINGTGSGEYEPNDVINIVAQPLSGTSFVKWIAEKVKYTTEEKEVTETILDENGNPKEITHTVTETTREAVEIGDVFGNAVLPVTSFTVPEVEDGYIIEVTAQCNDTITAVNLTMAVPEGGEDLPTAFGVTTDGVTVSDFAITPNDNGGIAKFETEYTATAKVSANDGYVFGENPKFCVNGAAALINSSGDGSYTVTFSFKTEPDLTVAAQMELGAAIRLTNGNGLRFITVFDAAKISELQAKGATVELGTLIAPKDLLGEDALTFDLDSSKYVDVKYEATNESGYIWHDNDNGDNAGQIAGSIVGIKESDTSYSAENGNIARDFVGRGYVKVTFNGKTVITYASYANGNIANNTRSLASVADAYRNDDTGDFSDQSQAIQDAVNKWADVLNSTSVD